MPFQSTATGWARVKWTMMMMMIIMTHTLKTPHTAGKWQYKQKQQPLIITNQVNSNGSGVIERDFCARYKQHTCSGWASGWLFVPMEEQMGGESVHEQQVTATSHESCSLHSSFHHRKISSQNPISISNFWQNFQAVLWLKLSVLCSASDRHTLLYRIQPTSQIFLPFFNAIYLKRSSVTPTPTSNGVLYSP